MNSYWQKLLLNINDSFNGYPIIYVSWDGEIKMFAVPIHATSVPDLPKGSLCVFFVEEISIDEDVIITVLVKILRMNSKGKIDVVVFIIITFWFISCDDHWISFLDIFLYPL
jgi:hypothetical protein